MTINNSCKERAKSWNKVFLWLNLVNSNIEMKQTELNKMSDLEGKIKVIFEKMNEEKKTYIADNQRMTK